MLYAQSGNRHRRPLRALEGRRVLIMISAPSGTHVRGGLPRVRPVWERARELVSQMITPWRKGARWTTMYRNTRKPSPQTLLVLVEFDRANELHGYELMKRTSLKTGTLYVILNRLKDRGYLTAEWRGLDEASSRPPRRVYSLTPKGREYVDRVLKEYAYQSLERSKEARKAQEADTRDDEELLTLV